MVYPLGAGLSPLTGLDCGAMDRRLARRNLRTALITAVIGLLMFALTFVAALLYIA
jgi:Na+-driven multidrug efflux pump